MNEKGFAATGILYTILVLFILLIFGMITMLYSRNNVLNKIKSEVKGNIQKPINLNLVTNGDLSFGDNTNFSSFTYGMDATSKFLSYKGGAWSEPSANELIRVAVDSEYLVSMNLKGDNTSAIYYIGFREYDVDKNIIYPSNVMYREGSLTSLARDLKKGDTVVYLKSAAGFSATSTSPTYQRSLIFWNYADSTGYVYPEETYSRYYYSNLFTADGIDTTNNTITLTEPWSGKEFKAGTKLSQGNSGSSYNYSLVNYNTLTSDWKTYSATISGVNASGSINHRKFRAGTKYISPMIVFGSNAGNSTIYMKDVIVSVVNR